MSTTNLPPEWQAKADEEKPVEEKAVVVEEKQEPEKPRTPWVEIERGVLRVIMTIGLVCAIGYGSWAFSTIWVPLGGLFGFLTMGAWWVLLSKQEDERQERLHGRELAAGKQHGANLSFDRDRDEVPRPFPRS